MTDPTWNSEPGAPVERETPSSSRPRLDELRAGLVLQREADAMIAEALETKKSALQRAEALVREAQQAAAQADQDAAEAAARRIAAARGEADRIVADARVQADEITSSAHAEVSALRDDAAELRDNAQQTIEAAELELEHARQAAEHRERQLLAALSEAARTVEHLERTTGTLEEMLAQVRGEIVSARQDLARLYDDFAPPEPEEPGSSVVLPWPHPHEASGTAEDVESATTDEAEAIRSSKHPRFDSGRRRGLLRRARS